MNSMVLSHEVDQELASKMDKDQDLNVRKQAFDLWQYEGSKKLVVYVAKKLATKQDNTEVEEVVYDARHKALKNVVRGKFTYQPGVGFTVYVKGIARNIIYTSYRHQSKLVSLDAHIDEGKEPIVLFLGFDDIERKQQIEQVLRSLSTRPRKIITLELQGYSYSEIAQALSVSEYAVRKMRSRAIAQLRQYFG